MAVSTTENEIKTEDDGRLPPGWRTVRFSDVVRNVKVDINPETSGLERYVAGEHMDSDDLHIRRWGTIGDGYLGPAFHRKFVKGQILYGSRRTYLRKLAVAEFDGICANTTFVLEPASDDLLPELLPFIMLTESFTAHSIKQSKGSVNPYINWRDIAWYEFALPPKDEQRRIARILWEAHTMRHHQHRAQDDLRRLRQVLTDDIIPDTKSGGAEHPITTLGKVCQMQNGRAFPSEEYGGEGIRLLRPGNLGSNGYFEWAEDATKLLPLQYLGTYPAYVVDRGDLVINLTAQSLEGGFMGRVCLARIGDRCLLNQRIGRFVCTDSILPEYLFRVCQTSRFRTWVEGRVINQGL